MSQLKLDKCKHFPNQKFCAHTSQEWDQIQTKWQKEHPILYVLDEIRKAVYYPCFRMWKRIDDAPIQIKWFFQRGYRGWADCDTWSFDYYLAPIIRDGLKRLNTASTPLRKTQKKWKKEVLQMSEAFDTAFKVQNLEGEVWKDKKKMKQMKKGMQLFIDNFFDLWD